MKTKNIKIPKHVQNRSGFNYTQEISTIILSFYKKCVAFSKDSKHIISLVNNNMSVIQNGRYRLF